MTLAAQPYPNGRGAERVPAGRGATLRDAVYRPLDIVIADLSATGFGMTTAEDLAVGSFLHLSLAGINKRDVRVIRRLGMNYGCEFAQPLSMSELQLALSAGVVVDASFAVSGGFGSDMQASPGFPDSRASPRMRVGVLVVTVALLWLSLLYAAHVLIGAFTSA